jgi:hypothetical protein
MTDGLKKCKDRAMKISGTDSKGGYMKEDSKGGYMDEDMVDEKGMYSDEERMKLAEEGMALPDGSYPIKNVEDLKNAIQAYGRAKDKEKAKAHIMKRAKELKAEDLIPENWNEEKTMDFAEFQLLKEQLSTLRVALD